MRLNLGRGLGIFPVRLHEGLGFGTATGRPVQSAVAKNSVFRPFFKPKAVRGTGTPTPVCERGTLCVEDRRCP